MIADNRRKSRFGAGALAAGIGTALGLATMAFASRSAVRDRSFTLEDGRRLVQSALPSDIPLTINEPVLAQLNRFAGTPEGRAFVKRGLVRMERYREMVEEHIKEFGLPLDLASLPLLESGYNNAATSPAGSAGIWQFMAATARRYGLIVGNGVDQRRDEEKLTVAAMRYLKDLHGMFGDWRLALKSYNEGEVAVTQLINEQGTSDPWAIEAAAPSREQYLAKFTAILLIVKNPALLD